MKLKDTVEDYCLLGLDVSTKTIGVALFSSKGELLELTHISPVVKPEPENKLETLIKKADIVRDFLVEKGYKDLNIKAVLIEEPLLQSNNVNTVGTLLRFNGMITKICYDLISVIPTYISTYESRKNAFPELMQPGATSKLVLFGAYPKDIDKKKVIWEKVAKLEPQINWLLDKKGGLKKENFDMTDAYTVTRAYMRMNNLI
jgi:hypothetical protein